MDLKKITENILEKSLGNNEKGLNNIANAESILKQAYEGRYIFELIQNVRDANREIEVDGEIILDIDEDKLTISNTGGGFSGEGIESITNIGESTKHSQDFIGHKGIGFKSILEITESPKITTRYGSIVFDKKQTLSKYSKKLLGVNKIPLFFFPHFVDESLNGSNEDISTKISLPFKTGIDADYVLNDFKRIKREQLVLLGNINSISCKHTEGEINFSIKRNSTNTVELRHNDEDYFYKDYSPSNKIQIPNEIITDLDEQEQKLFEGNANIDINILLELNEKKRFVPIKDAKLYLFYPLEITSGFNFLIHSYFIVSPDRKKLRSNNPLNEFIFKEIATFISGQLLTHLKKSYKSVTLIEIIHYKRNVDSLLNTLYDTLSNELREKKFIYDDISKNFYSPSEVIITYDKQGELFPNGTLNNKRIVFIGNIEVFDWLVDELEVEILDNDMIRHVIEEECKRQRKLKNYSFFQNLYNHANDNSSLDLTDKKVLLTSNNLLVSSEEDVFYGGNRNDNQISLSKSLRKKIHFIHPNVTISEFRNVSDLTGIKEFSTSEVISRLIKFFDDDAVNNKEVMEAILTFELDKNSIQELKKNVLLPVQGNKDWVKPSIQPIYFDTVELRTLYPKGHFIDTSIFTKISIDKIDKFLSDIGVWQIPAVYLKKDLKEITSRSEIEKKLDLRTNLSSRPFYLINDRVLDIPLIPNKWFTHQIISKWDFYRKYLNGTDLPTVHFRANLSSQILSLDANISWEYTSFMEYLSTENWIVLNEKELPISIKEVVGIDDVDFQQPHMQVVNKYLNTIKSSYYGNKGLFDDLGIPHLDSESLDNFESIFNLVYSSYSTSGFETKEFRDFFNRLLKKLFEYYAYKIKDNHEALEKTLENIILLSYDELTVRNFWKRSTEIYYKDNPGFYNRLPTQIKQLLQPQFTNQDKNTFGRIASKIGIKISTSLTQKLIESPTVEEAPITSKIHFLPEMLSLLEFEIDRPLTEDELSQIKNTLVVKRDIIQVEIKVNNSDITKILTQNHFSSKNHKSWEMYLINDISINQNKLIAEAVSDLFASIIGRELKRVEIDIKNFLHSDNKNLFLNDLNIQKVRIDELHNSLKSKLLNDKQLFYRTIIEMNGKSFELTLFPEDDISYEEIAIILGVSKENILEFESGFNFSERLHTDNIAVLDTFFKKLGICLIEFNKYSNTTISFKKYHFNRLIQLKNEIEINFEKWLYSTLKEQDEDEQRLFQIKLDKYKSTNNFDVDPNWLIVDYIVEFDKWFKSEFPNFKTSFVALKNFSTNINIIDEYNKNKQELIEALNKSNFTNEFLNEFLENKSFNSLLYFNFSKSLLEDYRSNYDLQSESPTDTENDNFSDLNQFHLAPEFRINYQPPISPTETEGTQNRNLSIRHNRLNGAGGKKIKDKIGIVAEMMVYELLSREENVSNLKWVSKYSTKISNEHAGYNPEGDDNWGYDLEYLDQNNNKIFVEVKGRKSDEQSFEISQSELRVAIENKDQYRLIFVSNTLDENSIKIRDLGNPFLFDDGEDFMNNKKFKANNRNYEIHFE